MGRQKTFDLKMKTSMAGPERDNFKAIGSTYAFPADEAERLIDYDYAEPVDQKAWEEHMAAKQEQQAKAKTPQTATRQTRETATAPKPKLR